MSSTAAQPSTTTQPSTTNSTTTLDDQINDLLRDLDESKLEKLSEAELKEMRNKLNPYGSTIEGSGQILTFSYTDLRQQYMRRLITTATIGFLNRMCDEWMADTDVPLFPVYDYVKNPACIAEYFDKIYAKQPQTPEKLSEKKDKVLHQQRLMEKRIITKAFLEHMFQFDPDRHVRSAYKPNKGDPERQVIDTPAANLAINHLLTTDPEFKKGWTNSESATPQPQTTTVASDLTRTAREMIPPADYFAKFNIYYNNNYEELRDVVKDLYCEKAEIETAVNPYSMHPDKADADRYISKHKGEVITTIYQAVTGKWNFFGPFKCVEESVNYYNQNTLVLEEIMKQVEADAKIGKQLMEKRIKINKQNNIAANGPDDPNFVKWASENALLRDMGAEKVVLDDTPANALEVPVYRLSNGGVDLTRDVFYSKADD